MSEMQEYIDVNINEDEGKNDIEIDFGRIFRSLWHYAWVIVVLAVVGAVLMFGYTKFMVTPTYQSTASLYIHDKNVTSSAGGSGAEDDSTIDYNTVGGNAATYLQNTYKRTLTSNSTLKIVIENLELEYSTDALRAMISSSVVSYPYFDITVTCDDPEEAAKIANELANVLYEQVSKIVGGSALTHVDEAYPPSSPSSPNTMKNVIIGFAAGFVLGFLAIIIIELSNNKINDDDYLISKYGISVLASITDSEALTHKGYGYYKKYGKYEYKSKQSGGNRES